jgi:membrane associated rhomboid family serine protease
MPFIFTTKAWPQLWRLFTAFLITKPKFAILMDPYFLYQYGSLLERESSRFTQPGDFFMYTAFVSAVIVVSTCTFLVIRVSNLRRIVTRLRLVTSKYLPAQLTNS